MVNLVNSLTTYLSQVTLLRWLTFPLGSQPVILSPSLLDFFLSSDTSISSRIAFSLLGNYDHVAVSVSIDFPSYSQPYAKFHCIVYDYSLLIGMVFVII